MADVPPNSATQGPMCLPTFAGVTAPSPQDTKLKHDTLSTKEFKTEVHCMLTRYSKPTTQHPGRGANERI